MPNHFRAIGATTFLSPIPAVMLSCRGTEPGFDRDNLITVAWAGVINSAPPMISVSLRPSRHSYAQIVQSGVFCLNLIDQSLCRAADFCGVKSGRDVDKFKEMRLHAREIGVSLLECGHFCTEQVVKGKLAETVRALGVEAVMLTERDPADYI